MLLSVAFIVVSVSEVTHALLLGEAEKLGINVAERKNLRLDLKVLRISVSFGSERTGGTLAENYDMPADDVVMICPFVTVAYLAKGLLGDGAALKMPYHTFELG